MTQVGKAEREASGSRGEARTDGLGAAARLLSESHRVAVLAHVNPDADAIGTVLGLTRGLRALGKEAVPVLSDSVPRYAQFLAGSECITASLPGELDVVVCADSADLPRVGGPYLDNVARFSSNPILNLDHHRTNPMYGQVNYVDPTASSSAEMAYRLLCALGTSIDADTATCLLFGIVGDTGSFQNGATTPGSLAVAAELVRLGADSQRIAFQLFEWKTFAAARLFGFVLSGIELDRERRIVIACMTQQMLAESGATADEMEGIPEYLRGIEEADMVIVLKETTEGDIRVSMRSRPAVDVSAIATALGGGGHRQAAGCSLQGTCGEARDALLAVYDRLNPR